MDASPLVFHEKFNFHDGNILMSASGSPDGLPSSPVETVHFRLHKSVLAIYSTTFADMLSMPQGDSPVENAVVHLQDPLDHVIRLLTAIYYGGSVPQEPLSRVTWNFLVPVLMLADKYDMGTLASNLLPKLLQDWPTTLAKWDDVDSRASSIFRDAIKRRSKNSSLPTPNDLLPEPAIAIRFGQIQPAARNILPAAFYHLSRLSHSSAEEYANYFHGPEVLRSADYGLLTSDDWLRVVRGQANVRDWLNSAADDDLAIGFNACSRLKYRETEDMDDDDDDDGDDGEDDGKWAPNPCTRRLWWVSNVKRPILRIGTEREVNVLARLKDIRDGVEHLDRTLVSEDQICYECHHAVVRRLDASRKEFWTRLPSFFRLEGYPNWGKS